jgi:hypothetical protein
MPAYGANSHRRLFTQVTPEAAKPLHRAPKLAMSARNVTSRECPCTIVHRGIQKVEDGLSCPGGRLAIVHPRSLTQLRARRYCLQEASGNPACPGNVPQREGTPAALTQRSQIVKPACGDVTKPTVGPADGGAALPSAAPPDASSSSPLLGGPDGSHARSVQRYAGTYGS